MKLDFTNRTVLVTGGTRGIGRVLAESYLEAGAKVFITGRTPINSNDQSFTFIQLDLSNDKSVEKFIKGLKKIGKIDVCVNNAGINHIAPLEQMTTEKFELVQKVNLNGPFVISKCVSEIMAKNKYGRIVNISSIWASITKSGRSAYSASKTGLIGLTRTLAVELAPANVLVNAVSPGFTLTDLTRQSLSTDEISELSNQIPIKRMAEPEELCGLVLYLTSDQNTYLTGQNITIDGGFINI